MQVEIPCVIMRGGTSKGPVFKLSDLPTEPERRDQVLLRIMGSPDPRQIDGIGGSTSVTSKVAIISESKHQRAQIDYLFAQVAVEDATVDMSPSCGNMAAAAAAYAVEEGLVPVKAGTTSLFLRNVNTNSLIEAIVETPNGVITYEGKTSISGVPGTGSPIVLRFHDIVGSKTGNLFPTGSPTDIVEGVAVSCVDVGMPMVFVRARDLEKSGYESKTQLDADSAFLARLERIRLRAALAMGMGDVSNMVIPKIALVAPPEGGGHLASRYFTPRSAHPAYAVLGSICAATSAAMPGTVVNEIAHPPVSAPCSVSIEHPSGVIEVGIDIDPLTEQPIVVGSLVRTARRLFTGYASIPGVVWGEPVRSG